MENDYKMITKIVASSSDLVICFALAFYRIHCLDHTSVVSVSGKSTTFLANGGFSLGHLCLSDLV